MNAWYFRSGGFTSGVGKAATALIARWVVGLPPQMVEVWFKEMDKAVRAALSQCCPVLFAPVARQSVPVVRDGRSRSAASAAGTAVGRMGLTLHRSASFRAQLGELKFQRQSVARM
jgi:hypothetical protein